LPGARGIQAEIEDVMKEGIHPEYRPVVFRDVSCDKMFLTRSSVRTKDTVVWEDGKEYPLVTVDVSSESHPFYTGKQRLVDAEGRVAKFNRKFKNFAKKK
jgi:large subunit ribosomal protein L31